MIASQDATSNDISEGIEPKEAKFTFQAGTEQTKAISKAGWLASKAARAARKEALLRPAQDQDQAHKERRLARVRAQLDVLQDCFDEAIRGTMYTLSKDKLPVPVQVFDPQHIDRLSASIGRVAELERQLSDWALPGSKRPALERKSRGSGATVSAEEVD